MSEIPAENVTGPSGSRLGRRALALPLLLVAGLALGACSTDGAEEEAAYPSVNSVPAKPDAVTDLAAAKDVKEGLVADREKAHYTEETLRADTETQAPIDMPKAEPKVEPAPKAEVKTAEKAPEKAEEKAPEKGSEPKVAAVPQAKVEETKMAEPAQKPAEKPTEKEVVKPAETATPAAKPAPTTVISGDGVEQTFQKQLAASSATAVPANLSEAAMTPAPAADMSAKAAAADTGSGSDVILKAPEGDGRVIPNPAASDGSEPVETIYFAEGSHRISASDRVKLRHIALIRERTGGMIRIVGHASSRTKEMPEAQHMVVNLNASQARATAVAAALLKLGVPADRLKVESVSDTEPAVSEAMTNLEAKNRRAEIFLLN